MNRLTAGAVGESIWSHVDGCHFRTLISQRQQEAMFTSIFREFHLPVISCNFSWLLLVLDGRELTIQLATSTSYSLSWESNSCSDSHLRFLAVITRAHHWPLFWEGWIHSVPSNPISHKIHFNIIIIQFNPRPCLRSYFSPKVFPSTPCVLHAPPFSSFSNDPPNSIWWIVHIMEVKQFSLASCRFFLQIVKVLSSASFCQTVPVCVFPLMWETTFHTHTRHSHFVEACSVLCTILNETSVVLSHQCTRTVSEM